MMTHSSPSPRASIGGTVGLSLCGGCSNGPSLTWEDLGGTNGDVRCGKGTTWEGGQRVPSIARWTGTIEPGAVARQVHLS